VSSTASNMQSRPEMEQALQAFTNLSENLLAGYDALRVRAEQMEAELVRTNAELASKVAELEAVLDALPAGVLVRDASGRVVRANDSALEILGRDTDEVVGELELCEVTDAALLDENATECLLELQRADEQRLVVARRTAPVIEEKQGKLGSIEVLDDRTALTEMAERVHQLDKMAALGTMAGGIAHEIRNPMNAIKGFAHLIERQLPEGSDLARFADRICAGVAEADSIIASMLTLASPEQLTEEECALDELVGEVRSLCETQAEAAAVELDLQAAEGTLVADRIKLRQALRNLVQNAIDVQPDGGRVLLTTDCRGTEVVFHVHDAGPGISPELARRVREPFFTTRAEGTGLGLALVQTIAELHRGTFELSKSPSPLGGAHVLLRIPVETNRGRGQQVDLR